MSFNPVELIEKAINEHGSAEILKERLALASDQFVALDRKASELEREIGKLQAQLQREQIDRDKAQQELRRLKEEHKEEELIHRLIEFKRGKRTGGKWLPFCPKCHMPAAEYIDKGEHLAMCSLRCGWLSRLPSTLAAAIGEVDKM